MWAGDKMKCRICGNEIEEQIYCPICGAPINAEQETQTEQGQPDYTYKYQGIDADATTVLSANGIVNEKEKEENREETSVVSGEVEMPRKSHKKLLLILSVIAAVFILAGSGIFCYFHYIYPNKITYMQKSIYFMGEEQIKNSEDLKLDIADSKQEVFTLLQANYEKNVFLYTGADEKSLRRIDKKGNIEVTEDNKIVSVVADETLDKIYYWTQEDENAYTLHCLNEKTILKRYITGVNGTVISSNGEYLAYSYKAGEDAYVVCEVMPSGEVNQIATFEQPVRVLGVTEEGKVFCEQQNPVKGEGQEGEEQELTYTVCCIQDKKSYGGDWSKVLYFGYYSNLDAFVIQTADKSLYYVSTKEQGEERLIATNVDWFTDASESCKYMQSCDRVKVLGNSYAKLLKSAEPCYYYLKENSLYSYDLLKEKESQKVAENFGRAQNIELWSNNLIFYLAGGKLYSCEKSAESWQDAKLLSKNCIKYQYAPEQECVYYLAGQILYSYKNGKEEKIADKVKDFDLNLEDEVLAYNTDTSIVICGKEEEEYAVKSGTQVFAVGQDVYYLDTKNAICRLSGETGKTHKEADSADTIMYIWR